MNQRKLAAIFIMVSLGIIIAATPMLQSIQSVYSFRGGGGGDTTFVHGKPIATSGDKNVYVTWWERNQTANTPVMKISTDNGKSFGPMLKLASNDTIRVVSSSSKSIAVAIDLCILTSFL